MNGPLRFGACALALVALLIPAGAGAKSTAGTLTIGQLNSLTGVVANACSDAVRGTQIALAEVNGMKEKVTTGGKTQTVPYLRGVEIKWNTQDDTSSPAGAVTAYRALRDSGAAAFVGPCFSATAQAVTPFVDNDKLPVVIPNPGSSALVTPQYAFRAGIPQPYFIGRSVQVMKARGIKSVYILLAADTPTLVEADTAAERTMKVLGIKVAGKYTATAATIDWTAAVAQIQNLKPDAVCLYINSGQITAPTAIRNAGLTMPFYGNAGTYADVFLKAAGGIARGTIIPTNWTPLLPYPASKNFQKLWLAQYPDLLSTPVAAASYDSAWRIFRAIHDGGPAKLAAMSPGTAAVAIEQQLAKQQSARTAQGPVTYLPNGDTRGIAAVAQVTDDAGGLQLLKVPTVKELLKKK